MDHMIDPCKMDEITNILSELLTLQLRPIQQQLQEIKDCLHTICINQNGVCTGANFPKEETECGNTQSTLHSAVPQDTKPTLHSAVLQDTKPTLRSAILQDTKPTQRSDMPHDTKPTLRSAMPQDTKPTLRSGMPQDTKPTLRRSVPQDTKPTLCSAMPQDTKPTPPGPKPKMTNKPDIVAPGGSYDQNLLRRQKSDNTCNKPHRIQEYSSDPIRHLPGSGDKSEVWAEDLSYEEAAGGRDTVKQSTIVPTQVQILRRELSYNKHKYSQALDGRRSTSIFIGDPTNTNQSAASFNYKALDQRIKPDSSYFRTVISAVEAIVEQIGKGMNMEPVVAGSSFEGLNIGYPYEFDIQLAMKDKFRFHKVEADVKVIDSCDKELTPVMMQERIGKILPKVIAKTKLPKGWSWFMNSSTQALHNHRKGFTVALELKKGEKMEIIGVLIDLIPSIKLPWEFVKQNFKTSVPIDELGDSAESSFHAVYQSRSTWRISASIIEHQILNKVDDNVKVGLRVAKYFFQTFAVDENPRFVTQGTGNATSRSKQTYGLTSLVPSYFLKNTFLKSYLNQENEEDMAALSCDKIVPILLANIEHSYSENDAEVKISRHFLFNDQSVNLTETTNNRKKICSTVREIKQHLDSGSNVTVSLYPLNNYPERAINSL